MNKKGAFTDIFVFIAGIFGLILTTVIVIFLTTTLKNGLLDHSEALQRDTTIDINATIEDLFGGALTSYNMMNWIIMVIFMVMVIVYFITNALIRTNPFWFIIYVMVVALAVVFAVIISNQYETIMNTPQLSPYFGNLSNPSWLMLNLPMLTTIIGFVGAILLFMNIDFIPEG